MAVASERLRTACRPRVIVFARVPRLGRVKTRLAAAVGDAEALRVHRSLLARTLQVAAGFAGAWSAAGSPHPPELELRIEGADSAGECAGLAARHGFVLRPQHGPDLGVRMHAALVDALGAGRTPVLVGCDCPVLEPGDLAAAFGTLAEHPAVFAPAEDGGYALVGLREPCPTLFDGIAWGTHRVMEQTRVRLRSLGFGWGELRTVWDVDEIDDYRRWRALAEPG